MSWRLLPAVTLRDLTAKKGATESQIRRILYDIFTLSTFKQSLGELWSLKSHWGGPSRITRADHQDRHCRVSKSIRLCTVTLPHINRPQQWQSERKNALPFPKKGGTESSTLQLLLLNATKNRDQCLLFQMNHSPECKKRELIWK